MRYKQEKNTKVLIAAIVFLCFCFNSSPAQTKSSVGNAQRIEKLLAETTAALQTGNFVRAKTILQEVLSIAPRNPAANTLAGIVADKENDLAKAEKHFALAAKIAPTEPETRNNYGAILLRLGRKKEAAKEFMASLAISSRQASALVNLAQIRVAEGDLTQARELFGKAKTIAPDVEILRALVTISLELREKKRAAQEFTEYIAAAKAESAPFRTSNKIRDVSFAEALLAGGLPDEAKQELESVLSNENQNVNALILLSKVFVQQKNITVAGRLLESAVSGGLDDAKVYLALAEVYEAGGYPENAIPAMRLAIEKDPNNEPYRIRYGLLLIDSKAPAAAVIRVEEAIKVFPKSARLRLLLGMAHFTIGKSNEAQTAFESALAIEPNLIPAFSYLATIYAEQGKLDEAAKVYERTIGFDDKNATLHYLLADTLLKMQNSSAERIESELKRAIALDANLASAYSVLGRLYIRQARWEEARAALERGLQINPKMADALYQLGLVYARLKRSEESKATLAKFKELNVSLEKQKEEDRREIVRRLANTKF